MNFFESLTVATKEKGGPLCIGIDPRIPVSTQSFHQLRDYGLRVVDACAPYAVAFKPQLAFFERHGAEGWRALDAILTHIHSIDADFPIILDAKRGDIGSTAEAYAEALLDRKGCLAVTLSPYLGEESIRPFLQRANAGVFILCRTSNPGSDCFQERILDDGTPLYLAVGKEAISWDARVGLVVAGNDVGILRSVRQAFPNTWFLAPGIGAQGGRPDQAISAGARSDGLGLLASASRSVADADNPARAAQELRDAMESAKKHCVIVPVETGSIVEKKERKEFFEGLFRIGAFKIGEFVLKSGRTSPFYIDLRRISGDPRLLELCGRAYGILLRNLKYKHIAGIPVAALPLASAAALTTKSSMIYPRLEMKKHGSRARVEGVWEPGDIAVMLDDLITTGGSKREALWVLQDAGLTVNDLVVLIERGHEGRRDMEDAGVRLHAWASISDVVEAGLNAGFIDASTAQRVHSYVEEGA